jgi:hypothetical protein
MIQNNVVYVKLCFVILAWLTLEPYTQCIVHFAIQNWIIMMMWQGLLLIYI